MTQFFAVFGNPILHSKSPQLFNSVFNEFDMDAFYTRIRPQSASDIIDIIRSMPLAGANITAPFKEDMVSLVDVVSLDAEEIGAINTIVNSYGRLIGYNTDHYGVTQSLREAGIELLGKKCLVLGGGGAARSVVFGLKSKGADVTICNRTHSKAKIIADDFGCKVASWENFDVSVSYDVVVSTLVPNALPPFLEKLDFETLLDASYKSSKVSELAKSRGKKIIKGKRWLLHQAIEAFRLIMSENPPIQIMENALNINLKKPDLQILEYPTSASQTEKLKNADLVISTKNLSKKSIKAIIDEEISKAFGN
ncbi:shikimate dehydrogenase family protein [Perlabentimonas gracilis]|uniref:shikimate dehydrogenase family protein n=1 Tax=Perlabentimonas gracilis TaxID=2715279 RepID=UPI001407D564|nr:shikimate dehydrogenase [Perlabentimonas gracilis]NHB68840.1 shikimate dehydrogenase [Perlabentimonas gracilis]